MIRIMIERILLLGKIPLCNGIVDRAPQILGICFPLCYRCTFVIISFFITLFLIYKKEISIKYIWLLLLPLIIDGSLQTFFMIESNNIRRSMTGMLFGIAMAFIVNKIYNFIDKKIPV